MSSNSINKNQQKIINDFKKFKNGAARTSMANNAEKSIFDKLDKNLDGKIDEKEQKGTINGSLNGKEQLFVVINTLSDGKMIVADTNGKEWVRTKDGKILNVNKNYLAEKKADRFYEIADDNAGINSIKKMQKFLETQVNADNIVDFLDKYEKSKKDDSSIIDTITSEFGASGSGEQKKVLDDIMKKLSAAAKKAGVSQEDINKAHSDFQNAYDTEYKSLGGAFRKTNPKDMEKALDFLRGAIKAKKAGGSMSNTEAIKEFKKMATDEHNSAAKNFNASRKEEGWAAKTGDTICGWFGCTTKEDMYKKFGNNKAIVDAMLNSKTEAEFKNIYQNGITTSDGKKIPGFGVPFDAQKLAARQKLLGEYQHAQALDNTIKLADDALSFKNSDYWQMASKVRENFGLKEDELNAIVNSYAIQLGKSAKQPDNKIKKEYLAKFLNDTKTKAQIELKNTSKGKSLEQMDNDLNLITRSAFGTNNILKDQIQYDENQIITGMITEAGAEIAGTIALQFVPGLGQMAAAKLAASSAKWGLKAVKITKALQKAEKGFETVQKLQTGQKFATEAQKGVKIVSTTRKATILNKTAQITSQVTSAGVATAAVSISDLKSKNFDLTTEEGRQKYEEAKKEVGKKILMNMSFAGVGAGSSMIAEKLAATYGIESVLAKEIAEEVMNAAGSYGVTKAAGDNYGTTDAFVDFASGLIISRISHVKGGNKPEVKPKGAKTSDAPKVDPTPTPKKDIVTASEPTKNNKVTTESVIFEPLTNETDISKSIKTLYPDITKQELQEINRSVEILKNNKNLKLRDIVCGYTDIDLDTHFFNNIKDKINKSKISYNLYKQRISNGKQITEMTNSELTDYYKKLVPYINDEELDCLINQVHRIQNGEPRYLGTQQEKDILESIHCKQWFGLRLKGIVPNRGFKTSTEFPKAEIEFKDKNLTNFQSNQLRHWIDDGKDWALNDFYDDLSIPLEKDTYLYRGVSTRGGSYKMETDFLNTIKDGAIINNSNKFISTAKGVEYASNYRNESYKAGQSYMLKIKVPKGTKVLDMRLVEKNFDEIVLQPHKLGVTSIDYNSGVVECEYIPLKPKVDPTPTPKKDIVTDEVPVTSVKTGDEIKQTGLENNTVPTESADTQEWRKIKVGDEEIEVPVTKNADGTDNIDFSKGRKLNDSGEYEYFGMTAENDFMANSSIGEKQSFFSRLFGKKTSIEVSQIDDKQLRKQVENTLEHYSCDLNDNIHHNSAISPHLSNAVANKGSIVKTLNRSANLNNISAYTANGGVCVVGNKLYVNENGKAVQLKMSKEKFEQLFPSEESILMTEQLVGTDTCWAISAINSMTKNGYGRAQLFKTLEELPDGSMVVHLKSGTVKDVLFPDGQPLPVREASMGDNAADGLSMIEQAILATAKPYRGGSYAKRAVNTVQLKPGQTMADMDFHDLITNACSLCYEGNSAMAALFTPAWATKTNQDAVRNFNQNNSIRNCIENFNPKTDFLNVTWSNHQKSVIGYDPATKIVTFHDPYNIGAVDTQCSLDEFVSEVGTAVYYIMPINTSNTDNAVSTVKTTPQNNKRISESASTPAQTRTTQTQTSAYTEKPSNTPQAQNTQAPKNPTQYEYKFEERTTKLRRGQFQPVAKTIEGNNIDAMISSKDGSVIIRKNGKETPVAVRNGETLAMLETSTDTFLIVTKDNNGNVTVKTSETGDISEKTLAADSSKNVSSKPASDKSNSSQQYNHSDAKIRPHNTQTRASEITKSLDGTPKNIGTAGKPIMARITGRPSGDTFTVEINGHTWNIKDNEPLRYPGGITITKKGNDLIAQTSFQTPATQPASSQIQQKRASANIPIPQGFREYGKVMGKRAIINANNVVMYETAHGWKKLN